MSALATRAPASAWPPIFQLLLFLLTVITVSRIHQHYSFLRALPIAMVLAGSAIVYAGLNWATLNPARPFRLWFARMVLVIAALACCSALFGISQGRAGKFIIDIYSRVTIYAVLLALAIRCARDLSLIVWAYVISCGILSWMALFVFGLSQSYGSSTMRLSNLYTYDANDLGVVLMVGFPLTILTLQTSGRTGKIASAVLLMGIGATIARTGSRGAFLGLLAVGVALLVMTREVSVVKRAGFLLAACAALYVAAPPGYWNQMRTLTDPKSDYNWDSKDGRRQIAQRGIGYMWSYPVFGVGINNFPMAEGTISTKVEDMNAGLGVRWAAAHNSFIQVAAELGIPGIVLWVGTFVGGIVSMIRLGRRLPPHWKKGSPDQRFVYLATQYLPLSVLGFIITSTFVSFAWSDTPYILMVLLAGVHVSAAVLLRQERQRGAPPRRPRHPGGWRPAPGPGAPLRREMEVQPGA